MKLGKELAKQARQKGICDEWHGNLKGLTDIDQLLEMYVRGIDFCFATNYPSNDHIRANFAGKMEAYGVHLDELLTETNPKKVIALGKCTGIIKAEGYAVTEVYLKDQCALSIDADGNSFVMVDMYGDTDLTVHARGNAKVCVNHFSGRLIVNKDDNSIVKIKEKTIKTY